MMTNIMVLSVLLCFVAGSAIDTGSICLVRTVNEAVAGKPGLALGCLVALLCAALVFTLDTALNWQLQTPPRAWPTAGIVVGAVVFGAGVALNGACGIGTITRLCRGDIGYAATVAGALAVSQLVPRTMLPTPKTDGAVTLGLAWFAAIGLVALPPLLILRQHLARRIIVSFAILGLIAATLANLRGDWTWLRLVNGIQAGVPVRYEALACVAAVLVGAAVTARFRRRVRFIRPDPRVMLREAAGGALMAIGAVMIPGGNDVLLVYGVPSGSPHAVAALAIIIAILVLILGLSRTARSWVVWPKP
jgi:uncharacterized membrane protein YedE/YeeE